MVNRGRGGHNRDAALAGIDAPDIGWKSGNAALEVRLGRLGFRTAMVNAWRVFKLAARAAVWRTTADPPLVELPTLLGFAVLLAAVRIALQLPAAGSWHDFNPYGLNATVAWIALELAVAAFFVRPAVRGSALSAMFVLSIFADLMTAALQFGAPFLAPLLPLAVAQNAMLASAIAANVFFGIGVVWWIGAMSAVVASLQPGSGLRLIGRVAALGVALFIADALVPHAPVFLPPHFDARSANWWEVLYALRQGHSGEAEAAPAGSAKLEKAQAALLKQQIAALAPRARARPVSMRSALPAGPTRTFSSRNSTAAWPSLAGVLPIKDRTVRLINNRATLETVPLADLQNFEAAVHDIAQVMNKDTDVLVLDDDFSRQQSGFMLQVPGKTVELTRAASRRGARQRRHQEPRGDCFGLLLRQFRSAARQRQHHRHDGRGCEKHIVRLRAGTRLDLFRRCLFPAKPASRLRFRRTPSNMRAS